MCSSAKSFPPDSFIFLDWRMLGEGLLTGPSMAWISSDSSGTSQNSPCISFLLHEASIYYDWLIGVNVDWGNSTLYPNEVPWIWALVWKQPINRQGWQNRDPFFDIWWWMSLGEDMQSAISFHPMSSTRRMCAPAKGSWPLRSEHYLNICNTASRAGRRCLWSHLWMLLNS